MATPAQSAKPGARPGVLREETTLLANHSNAQQKAQSPALGRAFCAIKQSPGPVTIEGKSRVSQNATRLGLFSTTAFVLPEEQEPFAQFKADYAAELCPQSPLEDTLAREIVHAAWRLRRCADLETNAPADRHEGAHRPPLGRPLCAVNDEELDRLQASIDRARTTAQRSFHRSLAELRRVQTERVYRDLALPSALHPENPGLADCRRLDPPALFIKQVKAADAQLMKDVITAAEHDFAKQSQPWPVATLNIPRNAPCPCGSREKYKRCCGKNAPPVLTTRAA